MGLKDSMIIRCIKKMPEKKLNKLFEKSLTKSDSPEKAQAARDAWSKMNEEQKRSKLLTAYNQAKSKDPVKAAQIEKKVEQKAQSIKPQEAPISEEISDHVKEIALKVLSVIFGVIFIEFLAWGTLLTALCALVASVTSFVASNHIYEEDDSRRDIRQEIINEMADIEIYFLEKYDISLYENLIGRSIAAKGANEIFGSRPGSRYGAPSRQEIKDKKAAEKRGKAAQKILQRKEYVEKRNAIKQKLAQEREGLHQKVKDGKYTVKYQGAEYRISRPGDADRIEYLKQHPGLKDKIYRASHVYIDGKYVRQKDLDQ